MKYICGMLLALLVTNAQADWCHDLGTIYTKSVYYYNKKITIDRVYDNVLSTYQGSDEALVIILNTIASAYEHQHNGYTLEMGKELLISDCRYSFSEGK